MAMLAAVDAAWAVESVRVPLDAQAIDLTQMIERHNDPAERIQVSTAPGSDGIVRRIEVSARESGAQPAWIVFALSNDTDEQIERLIVAPHYRLVGSGGDHWSLVRHADDLDDTMRSLAQRQPSDTLW